MIEISKETFEQYVPAFRDCEDEIFRTVEPMFEPIYTDFVSEQIGEMFDVIEDESNDLDVLRERLACYVCKRTAYEALPHLDLILTPNGFAVVSNQNLTPASRQRVYDLRERLRREKSDARDKVKEEFLRQGFDYAPNLLYSPTLLRKYGIRTRDGNPVYEEELQLLQSDIDAAQHKAAMLISEEQMQEILNSFDGSTDELIELCRRFMAAHIRRDDYNLRLLTHEVQGYLNRNADTPLLRAYRASSKYEADHFQPYENRKNDACYFFG
ncbi:MAG: hypothetical protein J6M53_05395 [Bacteroidaceae bacterium]|nr:hypothetical protein [Bacteroidaceae bacterium]